MARLPTVGSDVGTWGTVLNDYLNTARGFAVAAPAGNATTDSANIRNALSAANSAGGGYVVLQNGTYQGDTGVFAIPQNTTLFFQQFTTLIVACTGGASVDAITIDNGGAIVAQGFGGYQGTNVGQILAASSVNCRSLISNANHTLQEFFYINGLKVALNGGGTYAQAVIYAVACFVNSGIRDTVIACSSVNTGVPAIKVTGTASQGYGPFYIQDTWVLSSGGEGILITENATPGGAAVGVWLDNVTVEHPAVNAHHIHLRGFGGLGSVKIDGLHTENGSTSTSTTAGVCVDGVYNVSIRDYTAMCTNTANKVCVWVTSDGNNGRVVAENILNYNNMAFTIKDDTGGGGYTTADHVLRWNGTSGALPSKHYGSLVFGAGDLQLGSQSVSLASTAVDARNGNIVDVAALAAGVTVAAPTNPVNNQLLVYRFVQNGTGGNAVSWNAAFRVAAGVVSTTANKASMVAFRYDSGLSAWVQLWATTGV